MPDERLTLREKLTAKKLTPQMLADLSGYTKRYINFILSRAKVPSVKAARRISAKSKGAIKFKDLIHEEE